jgi:hypothetical protein
MQAIKMYCEKWIFAFTNHLEERVRSTLSELSQFIDSTSKGLDLAVKPGDRSALMQVLCTY